MTARQEQGAVFDAQERGAMHWRLETLHKRTEEGVRKLGAEILEMYHQGSLDPEAVREGVARLDQLERSAAELEQAIRDEPREAAAPRPPRRPAPARLPALGAQEQAAGGSSAPVAEAPRDGRMREAVEAARFQARELDAEMRRLQAESDAEIAEALAKVEADTRARAEREAERRLAEQEKRLRAEAEERVRATAERVRQETEEELRAPVEAQVRSDAADWLRSRTRELVREAEEEWRQRLAEAKREATAARREAEQQSVERQREAKGRAEAAERKRREAAEQGQGQKPKESERETDVRRREEAAEKNAVRADAARRRRDEGGGARTRRGDSPLDVNTATFEQLRGLGLSVTQATRVIAQRERKGGFDSVADLATVPGLPTTLLSEIKDQVTV
jgi:DNA uptake protein ComE-like DNA-binding protein